MEKRTIQFSPPDISEYEIEEVARTLRSGWITTGPKTKLLERRLAAYIETGRNDINCETQEGKERYSNRVVCLNSATAAEELIFRILGVKEGDEVIVPAYTYTASASAAIHCGATVKFVDIQKDGDPVTHAPEMDYSSLETAITEKTKAIVTVDLGGLVCDYDRVYEIVERKRSMYNAVSSDGSPLGDLNSRIQNALGRVAVVADCAHALGASRIVNGERKYCGAIADFSDFSFHAVKNFTTAEGGAATWLPLTGIEDAEIYKMFQMLSLHGQNKDALAKSTMGSWEYDVIGPWYKCNMTDVMAAIGLRQLDRYNTLLLRRDEIIKRYDSISEDLGLYHLVHHTETMDSSRHLYLIRVPNITSEQRDSIINKMAELGVATNVHYKPLPMMTAYGSDCSSFPNAYDYYHNLITLPLHTLLSNEDVDYICYVLRKAVNEARGIQETGEDDTYINDGEPKADLKPFNKKIWLSSPTMHGDEQFWVNDAIRKNWVSTVGENIDVVEAKLAEYTGMKYAVGLSAGTAALHLATKLAGEKLYGQAKPNQGTLQGHKVFASDLTFDASINPIAYEDGDAVFIDTEPETWNMSPAALKKAFEIYPDTKLVVLAHLYGTPGKMEEIKAICAEHGALIVEDAAESLGAKYKLHGQWVETGSLGDFNCISFNGNKIITGSCGGMFLTNSKEYADKVRKWSTQSREDAPWYQHEEIGYNYRMSNLIAGVIRGQIPYLDEHIAQKRAIYERYREGLKDLPVHMNPYDAEKSMPNFWLSCMIIDEEYMCKQVRDDQKALYVSEPGKSCPTEILETMAHYNAEGRPIWKPMHMQPIYRNHPFITVNGNGRGQSNAYIDEGKIQDVGMDVFRRGLCLPSDNKMTLEQQEVIIEIIHRCFQ